MLLLLLILSMSGAIVAYWLSAMPLYVYQRLLVDHLGIVSSGLAVFLLCLYLARWWKRDVNLLSPAAILPLSVLLVTISTAGIVGCRTFTSLMQHVNYVNGYFVLLRYAVEERKAIQSPEVLLEMNSAFEQGASYTLERISFPERTVYDRVYWKAPGGQKTVLFSTGRVSPRMGIHAIAEATDKHVLCILAGTGGRTEILYDVARREILSETTWVPQECGKR